MPTVPYCPPEGRPGGAIAGTKVLVLWNTEQWGSRDCGAYEKDMRLDQGPLSAIFGSIFFISQVKGVIEGFGYWRESSDLHFKNITLLATYGDGFVGEETGVGVASLKTMTIVH